MAFPIRIRFDNSPGFPDPHLWAWYDASSATHDVAPAGHDGFGPFFDIVATRNFVRFKFKDGAGQAGPWEADRLHRSHWPLLRPGGGPDEVWCLGDRAFVYSSAPRRPAARSATEVVRGLAFPDGLYVPGSGGLSGLGALPLADGGGVLFGLYHPNAARVFVAGDFNGWQSPDALAPDPARFEELELHRGWFGAANTWLKVVPGARAGQEYKFYVEGGVPRRGDGRARRWTIDPYARRLGPSFDDNNGVVEDPTRFVWTDGGWRTPDMGDLILYEMSVYGFTEGDPEIRAERRGRFAGVTERIRSGYFRRLGVTALSLMPLTEFPSMQGPGTLGYNSSVFPAVERDFGAPDDLRELVDEAHRAGLAVLLDQVFNHTDNGFNPLWQSVLEHPDEEDRPGEGGLYFEGGTPWGNRIATGKEDVQNLLIDTCKMWIREYHVDGFRFDATNARPFGYMDARFRLRLAEELKGYKPDVLLVAENLPNEADLNRAGFDGYAQWCDPFHDKIKALLLERRYEGQDSGPEGMGDIFYFSRGAFAAHTNNVVNYCESHDENSVANAVEEVPMLSDPATKQRKARLGLLASAVALGQPMIYMGQEFGEDRPRNVVTVEWPANLDGHGFFQWASRLLNLRRRYPGLRMSGYDPAGDGRFAWILGPWMDGAHGGGRRVLGWRARPNAAPHEALVVLLNFEGSDRRVDVEFGLSGVWVKLADIERADDIAPQGTNSTADAAALRTHDGRFSGFVLPSTSGFVYKWETP